RNPASHRENPNVAGAAVRMGAPPEPESQHDHGLAHQHPRPAMPEPAGQYRDLRTIDERRPQELERGDQRDQAEEADHFERKTGSTQPGRQCVENKEIRETTSKSQGNHHQGGGRGEYAERRQDGAPPRRGFGFAAHSWRWPASVSTDQYIGS